MDPAVRQFVHERAHGRCEYCRLREDLAQVVRFQIEHIRPRQHGGDDSPANLALACPRCNAFKGPNLTAIDALSGRIVRLYNPRTQRWNRHFKLVGIEIHGRTKVGRATAGLLRMNVADRLKVRAALAERGELEGF